jgi:ATP-dependent exoDNAse (exonuclease V) alpha subunit
LAWHDNGWNGQICKNPGANTYCCGSHSLLSERIARDKRTALEMAHPAESLDSLLKKHQYLPPCYWSSSAFSQQATNIVHVHPFKNYSESHQIKDKLPGSGVYTWPFRLSLTHGKDAIRRDGNYPEDWDARADRYLERLTENESIVFFYLNYDNPVSADEYKYALVGCARLSSVHRTGTFDFSAAELKELQSGKGMQNFGAANWALKVCYDLAKTGVRLPYHEYLAHIEQSPDDEPKLEEIKVVVDEPALLPGVKYVTEEVGNDACLYLLYKLRRAFEKVKEHGIASPGDSLTRLDGFIRDVWKLRGLYPGLANVVGLLASLREGDPDWTTADDSGIVASVQKTVKDEVKLLGEVFSLLSAVDKPGYLNREQIKTLRQARRGFQQFGHLEKALRRLSLFDLTPRQLTRILFPDVVKKSGEVHPFPGRTINAAEIGGNPYVLCEEYVPATDNEKERQADLNRELRTDGQIDYFTIDIGLFPDEDRYECLDDALQNLLPTGKERLRAFAVTTLREEQQRGHTYAPLHSLVEMAQAYPLFYRNKLAITREHFLSPGHLAHFKERLHIEEEDGELYLYLKETKAAEDLVGRILRQLIDDRGKRKVDTRWVDKHVKTEAACLAKQIKGFLSGQFCEERCKLIEGILTQRLFFVTGRPGSGKTRALREVVAKLVEKGERVTILAPTGKATLRVTREAPDAQVETIDRWLSRSGLRTYAENLETLGKMGRSKTFEPVQNLIIDEASMIDLGRLATVLRALEVHEPDVRRVVFVGDENQLPPIGMGRPLYDILAFLNDAKLSERHLVRLRTNCRQRQDQTVLDAAYLFAGKNRYRTDLYQQLLAGGEISSHLHVEYWETPEDLYRLLTVHLDELLRGEGHLTGEATPEAREKALNLLFNLYETGYAKGYREKEENKLRIDAVQLLSPYRGGFAGSLGVNQAIRDKYRGISYPETTTYNGGYGTSAFAHSDKIIRITNYYAWVQDDEKNWSKELVLSNGSIGIVCNNRRGRQAVFPDGTKEFFYWSSMEEDDFEAAYAISVHKAQGSEFSEVFVVIPERRSLLSKELVYTAMTRSTGRLKMFVQRTPRENPLEIARGRSELLRRNSSLLTRPVDAGRVYEPEPGVRVKSKVEYVIYETLRAARAEGRLTFDYEKPPITLPLGGREIEVKPDFTIHVGARRYFWEHLGRLDQTDYFNDWKERRQGYEAQGLGDALITTDDLNGIRAEALNDIVTALLSGNPVETPESPFSRHHYDLGFE